MASIFLIKRRVFSILSLTVPRYTNGRASDLNSLQEIIHVSRLSFFTHSLTRSFFVSSLKERNYTYSMYLSTVKVGSGALGRAQWLFSSLLKVFYRDSSTFVERFSHQALRGLPFTCMAGILTPYYVA